MAFSKKIELDDGVIGIWEITEDVISLSEKFYFLEFEKKEFEQISSERRRKEYLVVRLLLKELLNKKAEIAYDNLGRPALKNSDFNLSVSHSKDLAVVFLSEKRVGIDVENVKRNIENIAVRFLHKQEKEYLKNIKDKQKMMMLLWCAKEAIFKCSEKQGIDFSKEIYIHPFSPEKGTGFYGIKTQSNRNTFYRMQYFNYKNNVVVFCVEEEEKNHE